MEQGVTRHENQSRFVQCGKQGTGYVPLNYWADKTGRMEVHDKVPNSEKGSRSIMAYRLQGLHCVKEVATNCGGVKKC